MAQRRHSPTVDRAVALAGRGSIAEAFQTLTAAAETSGDALAALTLADWRMAGDLIRRDLGEARRLYGRAADLGIDEAEPIHLALLANGAGGPRREWAAAIARLADRAERDSLARRQLDLLNAMTLDAAGNPLARQSASPLHGVPRIARIEAFLSPDEARYLADIARPLLQPAVVVHPQTGQMIRDPIRTARSAGFPFVREDPVIHAVNRRIAAATGTDWAQGEPLQVLWYEPGEEYKLHSDALPPGQNQRIATFIVALNADYEGGETAFPRIGLSWRGAAGEALHFANVDDRGQPEPLAWHAGQPVRSGRKLLLSKWLRAAPLDLSGPPGRPF